MANAAPPLQLLREETNRGMILNEKAQSLSPEKKGVALLRLEEERIGGWMDWLVGRLLG